MKEVKLCSLNARTSGKAHFTLLSKEYSCRVSEKFGRWLKRVNVQIKCGAINSSVTGSVFIFIQYINAAYYSNEIHEGDAISPFSFFIRQPIRAVLLYGISAINNNNAHKQKELTMLCHIVNYSSSFNYSSLKMSLPEKCRKSWSM